MSKNRRNFHYHYAEQYETKAERRERRRDSARRRARYAVTPAALVTAVIMLVVFGLMSTTFSSYADKPDSVVSEAAKSSGVLSQLRSTSESLSATKIGDLSSVGASNEIVNTGAVADIADIGANSFTYMPQGMKIYLATSSSINWNSSGAKIQAELYTGQGATGTSSGRIDADECSNYGNYRFEITVPTGGTYRSVRFYRRNSSNNGDWNNSGWQNISNVYQNEVELTGWDSSTLTSPDYNKNDAYGHIYFDNSITNWSGKIYFLIGKSDYVYCSEMSPVQNASKLYYTHITDYDNYAFFGFAYKSSGSLNSSYSSISSAYNAVTGCTTVYGPYELTSQTDAYVGRPLTSGNVVAMDFTYQSTSFNYFDATQTLTVGAHGSATISGYEFTAHGSSGATATSQTVTGSGSNTISAAKSSTVTVDISHDTGYAIDTVTFDGNDVTSSVSNGRYTYTADGSAHTVAVTYVELNYCALDASESSVTLDVCEVDSVNITASHHTTGNVVVSVSQADSAYVLLSNASGGAYGASATLSGFSSGPTPVYIKGIRPTSSPITVTVSCGMSDPGATPATFTVEVNATDISPNSSSGSWALSLFYDDSVSAAVTPSPSSGATVTYDTTLYADNAGNSVSTIDATINASTGSVYISNSSSNVGTGYVKITVTYDTGYTVDYYRPITVVARPTCALRGLKQDHDNSGSYWDEDGNMTYQSGGTYTIDVFLQGNETYGGGSGDFSNTNNYGFKIFYNNGYKANSGYWVRSTNCSNIDVSSGGSGSNMAIVTGTYGGFYTFTYNPSTDRLSVTYPTAEKYYLVGFNDVWPTGFIDGTHDPDEYEITVDGSGNGSVTETFTATESDSFKIYGTMNNKYWGCDATIGHDTDLSSGYTFYDNTVNCHFNAWYSGEYTFTFTGISPSSSTCTLTGVTAPARNVNAYAYFINTTTPVTQAGRTYVTMTDNYNDTWTVTTLTPSEDDSYEFNSWNSTGSAGTTTTTASTYGTIYQTVVTVTDGTQTDIIAYWNNKSYSLKLYTRGATLPQSDLTGATFVQTSGSGDNLCYEYTYHYGTAVTLPIESTFTSMNSTWHFAGWYASSSSADMAGAATVTVPNTTSGPLEFWPKLEMTITFTDNVSGSTVIDSQTVLWGGTVTPPNDSAVIAATGYTGFTRVSNAWNLSGFNSFNNIKSGGTAYARFIPVIESTPAVGVFSPGTNVTTSTVTIDGNSETLYTIGFGSVLSALFSQPTAYNSAPESAITYEYMINVNGNPVAPYHDMSYQYNTAESRYEWYTSSDNIATMLTLPNTADTDYGYAVITFRAYFTDAQGNKRTSSETKTMKIYYAVDSPFTGLTVTPYQRIYSDAGSVPAVVANFVSHHEDASDTADFTNSSKYKVEVSGAGITTPGSTGLTHGTGENYSANLSGLLTDFLNKGVKDFVIRFMEYNGSEWLTDGSATSEIHTTVGTSDSVGSRPLYFVADAACDGYGVMMFYFDAGGDLAIQTGESFNRSGENTDIYRFNVPSGDISVAFALVDTSASYELPAVSGAALDFSSVSGTDHYYYAYTTSFVSVGNSIQSVSATGVSGTALSCEATPMLDVD